MRKVDQMENSPIKWGRARPHKVLREAIKEDLARNGFTKFDRAKWHIDPCSFPYPVQ